MKTSIIMLTVNHLNATRACIESIRRHTSPSAYELIVVDNGSTDGTIEWLNGQPDIRLLANPTNVGFPAGCNQGLAAATGDSLLLLNNDTVVTPRWLEQLLACLRSDDRIGAVGPVTNYASYYTAIPASYGSLEEMTAFADTYNRSDQGKWLERLKLVGFCLLFKRSVYEKIGGLDERFTPGNFEDDDYSIRILRAGYRLMLCQDTFIHHEGGASFGHSSEGFQALMQQNSEKFKQKWGFSTEYSMLIRTELLDMIDEPRDRPLRVLEVGCACGATLVELKNRYPLAELHGIELNPEAAAVASLAADVRVGNIETMELDDSPGTYDYILFADVLEHLLEPWNVLHRARSLLKPEGKVLASLPNVAHYTVIRDLIQGKWQYTDRGLLDITHLRFFTLESLYRLFWGTGFGELEFQQTVLAASPEDEAWMDRLAQLAGEEAKPQWKAYQYLVKASAWSSDRSS